MIFAALCLLAHHPVLSAFSFARAITRADTVPLLIEVRVAGVTELEVEAELQDSVLLLSATTLHDVFGLDAPLPWTSLPALVARYPTVSFQWLPRKLLLLVDDPRAALPVTQAAQRRVLALGQGVPGAAYQFSSGPFGAITVDDRNRERYDAGFSWRGRLSVGASAVPGRPVAWQLAASPVPQVAANVSSDRTAALRLAAGPAWLFGTWQAGQVALDGLVHAGAFALFASTRDVYLVTISRVPVTVQAGRQGGITTARVSFGPLPASPFFLPTLH